MSLDRNIIDQAREANFLELKTFLKNNHLHLPRREFSAVLYAINGMTIYDLRKQDAIKRSSAKYQVTQVSIKKILDKMGIKSNRARKAQKEFALYHHIGLHKHRQKMDDHG
ncbi:hypothetical protein [Salipaludibacillus daqingensis]|uniref:hypothetical protein n=1 Tax=Salipaludibacillus daqingensis TaxID=3041001 RepID=UPI002473D26F|nr:hypothetical protein [Salipaludibacillus daqingensis]